MTGVLLVKAHADDNHRLLSYHDNGFCDTIITLSILLHVISQNKYFEHRRFHPMIYKQQVGKISHPIRQVLLDSWGYKFIILCTNIYFYVTIIKKLTRYVNTITSSTCTTPSCTIRSSASIRGCFCMRCPNWHTSVNGNSWYAYIPHH